MKFAEKYRIMNTLNPMKKLSQNLKLDTTTENYFLANIKTATEFSKALFDQSLRKKVDSKVKEQEVNLTVKLYELFKNRFNSIVQDDKDFETLIDCLEEYLFPQFKLLQAQQGIADLCCSLKKRLPSLIKSSQVICQLFRYLPAEKFSEARLLVCESLIKEDFFSGNVNDKKNMLAYLQPAEQISILESLRTNWDSILKNPEDFNQIISSLAADECVVFCQSLATYWPSLIKNPKDYNLVVSFLKDHGHTAAITPLFNSLQTHWPSILKTTSDLVCLLDYLIPMQRQEVYGSLVKDWPSSLIENIRDLQLVSYSLNDGQFKVLCETLKCLPTLIEGQPKDDLERFVRNVESQKVKILFACLKKDEPLMKKNAEQASGITHASTFKLGTSFPMGFFKFFSKKLPLILKSNLSLCLTLKS